MQSDQLPKVQTIYESIIEKEIDSLVNACVEKYMNIVFKNASVITSKDHISTIHDSSKNQAICMYIEAKKMGNSEHESKFRIILEQKIETNYEYWRNEMEGNIIQIEKEKKKMQEDLQNKYKLDRERIENEKRQMEQTYKDELKKNQESLEEMKRSKNNEIEKLKRQAKEEREAQEREFRIERLKAKIEMDNVRAKNDAEVAELKRQLERQKEALEEQVELAKMGNSLQLEPFVYRDISSTMHEFRRFHIEMSQGISHLFFGMRSSNYSDSDSD
jgi:DNA repair exonuclease SbcCD ATPase subunit